MALTKAKLIADNAVKAVHIDETDTGITLAQLNVTGDITATNVSGNVTGNVTGDLTGTILTAAQPNITSVGMLSSLAINGGLQINGSSNISTLLTDSDNSLIALVASSALVDNKPRVQIIGSSFASDSNTIQYLANTHAFFGSNASLGEKVRIDSSGNVGIGTSSPDAAIHANVSTAGANIAKFSDPNNRALIIEGSIEGMKIITTEESDETDFDRALIFQRGNVETMRINSNGNVGIGTTDILAELAIKATNAEIHLQPNADTEYTALAFRNAANNSTRGYVVYDYSGDYMSFRTNGIGEKMRITSAGNVGIGLTDPRGDLSFANQVANGTFAPTSYTASSTIAGQNFINNYYTSASYGTYNYPRYMDIVAVGQPDGTSGGSHIRFFTNPRTANAPSEVRMDIAYDGTVLFNKGYLYVGSSNQVIHGGSDASNSLRIWQRLANNIDFLTYDQTRMRIDANGNIGAPTGTNIYNASDQRVKRNIRPISDGLNTVLGLNPVKFNWIQGFNEYEEDKELLGFIAQEIQQTLPEAVEQFAQGNVEVNGETIENTLRVNEKFIIPVLAKAIQELKEIIDNQQIEIDNLKAQLNG